MSFVFLGKIAMSTKKLKIGRVIIAATRKWSDMINMVSIFKSRPTVNTQFSLGGLQCNNVISIKESSHLLFAYTPSLNDGASFLRIRLVPLACSFINSLSVFLAVNTSACILASFTVCHNATSAAVRSIIKGIERLYFVAFGTPPKTLGDKHITLYTLKFAARDTATSTAARRISVFVSSVPGEFTKGKKELAARTVFRIHAITSAVMSLQLKLWGGLCRGRFSGATLSP